jgi:hypothetical protein
MKLFKSLKKFCSKTDIIKKSEISQDMIRKNYLKGMEKASEEFVSKDIGDVIHYKTENIW